MVGMCVRSKVSIESYVFMVSCKLEAVILYMLANLVFEHCSGSGYRDLFCKSVNHTTPSIVTMTYYCKKTELNVLSIFFKMFAFAFSVS